MEKRKFKRRHLIFYLRVIERESNAVLGFLVDITTQGIMMMSEFPTEIGKTFHLKLLTDAGPQGEKFLEFQAVSKWCERSVNTDFYDTGFELIDINPDDLQGIRQTIAESGFNDWIR
jgi:hypothetical protein